MNLIERLGGYKNSKGIREAYVSNGWSVSDVCKGFHEYFTIEDLDCALLEYRRQHNIYEVGDLITHPAYDWKILKVHDPIPSENTLFAFTNDHVKHHWGHGIVFEKNGVVMVTYNDCRHATDEEIAAGHRL